MGCFSPGKSESESISYIPKQEESLKKALSTYMPTLGQGMNVYQGQRVAPLSESQQGVFNFASQGPGFITTPEEVNEYFQSGVKDPTMKALSREVLPAVREAFSGPGYWGSARATEEARATEDTIARLNQQKAVLDWETKQANKAGAMQQLQVGTVEQQHNQDIINASMQKFAEENQITDPTDLAILMNLLGINMGKSTGMSEGPGIGYNLASDPETYRAGAEGAGAALKLFGL